MFDRILFIGFLIVVAPMTLLAQDILAAGTTTALWKSPTTDALIRARELGFEYVEVAINQFYRNVPPDEVRQRICDFKKTIDSSALKVWSIHLPFSKSLDISIIDDAERQQNVDFLAEIITLCAIFEPQKLVLHSSSEPIDDAQRAQRIKNAIRSIDYLRRYAEQIGTQLCVENLPRTCLGNTPEELLHIIANFPDVGICFDTNHFLRGTTSEFIEKAGHQIATIHASDCDGENECHWIPRQGIIDWSRLVVELRSKGYKGVFMFEAIKDRDLDERAKPEALMDSYLRIIQSSSKTHNGISSEIKH